MTSRRMQAANDDAALVKLMREGNRGAFAELFRRHRATVYRFARQMSGSRDMAEDITQDVFVSLMQQGDRFDPRRGSLTTYLYGISRNLARRRLSPRLRGGTVDLEAIDGGQIPALVVNSDPPTAIDRTNDLAWLRRAILALPARHREVIVLCELHELSYEQAAQVVGCPVGTIRSRLSRARSALVERCNGGVQRSDPAAEARTARRCLA